MSYKIFLILTTLFFSCWKWVLHQNPKITLVLVTWFPSDKSPLKRYFLKKFFSLRFYLLSLERGLGREKDKERNIDVREMHWSVASCMHPDLEPNRKPGMCPDREIKPFALGDTAPPELHWSESGQISCWINSVLQRLVQREMNKVILFPTIPNLKEFPAGGFLWWVACFFLQIIWWSICPHSKLILP